MATVTYKRNGSTVTKTTVETLPAVIDYNDILNLVKVRIDPYTDMPWEISDLFEHVVRSKREVARECNIRKMEGYIGKDRVIIITDKQVKGWGTYDYLRSKGASRQVARECESAQKREAIKQLVKWYTNGYTAYFLTCDYAFASDCIGGVEEDSLDYHKHDVAGNVARQLQRRGHTILNMPASYPTRQDKVDRIKRQLSMFNTDGR